MAEWAKGDVIANGVRLHYHRTGGDKPALVLSHSATDNGLYWTRVARALEQDYDVIMYDQRGHGLSDAPESGYDFENQAVDLAGLIAALDLKRPRAIGHSGGAAIVAAVAANYPDLLTCVILEDPPWGTGGGEWDSQIVGMRQWFLSLGPKTREELIVGRRASSPGWPEEEVALWAEGKLQMSPNAIQIFEQPQPPWRDWIRKITCPILLITSDLEQGALNTLEDVQEMAGLWHEGKAVRINGTGHMIHCDQYEAYMQAVQSFLAHVEAREEIAK
ncbi:MAG: alpha/beta hydrolase [Anaerolineae bacterium]|nr:alpha/beta hydrolase [Anaerolineae bacterium]